MKNELTHYGVLGMKWGIRHDKDVRSGTTKRLEKKLSKGNLDDYTRRKYQAKIEKSSALDKKMKERISKASTGELVAQRLLLGHFGAKQFNQLRAQDVSMGKSIARAALTRYGEIQAYSLANMALRKVLRG